MKKALVFAGLLAASSLSHAACSCQCVNGDVRQLCSSPLDLPAICAPQICPIVPPAIQPIQAPMLPPLGTSSCRQVQVYDSFSRQYVWRTVCQ